jgi:TonB family protein
MKKTAISLIIFCLCSIIYAQEKNKDDSVYIFVEKMPEFPGGEREMMSYISKKAKIPENIDLSIYGGGVFLNFVVTKAGKPEDIRIVRSSNIPEIDSVYVDVVKGMPNWTPGTQNGRKVNVRYNLRMSISLKYTSPIVQSQSNINTEIPIIVNDTIQKIEWDGKSEKYPQFQGGRDEMIKFIEDNTKYPLITLENNIGGSVTLNFIVSHRGEIKDIRVARGIDAACDREAIRAIRSMPKWVPAQKNGKNIDAPYSITIFFNKDYIPPRRYFTPSPPVLRNNTLNIIHNIYFNDINKEIDKLRYYKAN